MADTTISDESISSVASASLDKIRANLARESANQESMGESISSMNSIMNNLVKASDGLATGTKKLVGETSSAIHSATSSGAKAIRDSAAEYASAIKQDINVNRQNLMMTSLSTISPVAGYFATKMMDTGVIRNLKESMGKALSGIANRFKNIATAGFGKIKGIFSGVGTWFKSIRSGKKKAPDDLGIKGAVRGKQKYRFYSKGTGKFLGTEEGWEMAKMADAQLTMAKEIAKITKDKDIIKNVKKTVPHLSEGGYIKKGGLVNVHAGEVVQPVEDVIDKIIEKTDARMEKKETGGIFKSMRSILDSQNKKFRQVMEKEGKQDVKNQRGFIKSFTAGYTKSSRLSDLYSVEERMLRVLIEMRDTLGFQEENMKQAWEQIIIDHPMMRYATQAVKGMTTFVDVFSGFKVFRWAIKLQWGGHKYRKGIANSGNHLQDMSANIAHFGVLQVLRLDQIIENTQRSNENLSILAEGLVGKSAAGIRKRMVESRDIIERVAGLVTGSFKNVFSDTAKWGWSKLFPKKQKATELSTVDYLKYGLPLLIEQQQQTNDELSTISRRTKNIREQLIMIRTNEMAAMTTHLSFIRGSNLDILNLLENVTTKSSLQNDLSWLQGLSGMPEEYYTEKKAAAADGGYISRTGTVLMHEGEVVQNAQLVEEQSDTFKLIRDFINAKQIQEKKQNVYEVLVQMKEADTKQRKKTGGLFSYLMLALPAALTFIKQKLGFLSYLTPIAKGMGSLSGLLGKGLLKIGASLTSSITGLIAKIGPQLLSGVAGLGKSMMPLMAKAGPLMMAGAGGYAIGTVLNKYLVDPLVSNMYAKIDDKVNEVYEQQSKQQLATHTEFATSTTTASAARAAAKAKMATGFINPEILKLANENIDDGKTTAQAVLAAQNMYMNENIDSYLPYTTATVNKLRLKWNQEEGFRKMRMAENNTAEAIKRYGYEREKSFLGYLLSSGETRLSESDIAKAHLSETVYRERQAQEMISEGFSKEQILKIQNTATEEELAKLRQEQRETKQAVSEGTGGIVTTIVNTNNSNSSSNITNASNTTIPQAPMQSSPETALILNGEAQ